MTVAAETLLEALLAAPIGVAVVDSELRYVRFNSALAAMNDSDPNAPIGRTVREVVPHLADQLEPALRRVLQTGEAVRNLEVIGVGPDEGRSWVEHLQPLRDEAGSVAGVVVVIEEDTERRLEAARREAALRERLDAIPHHAWMTDGPGGRVTWYNRRWHDYTGLSEADVLESRDAEIVHPADRELLEHTYVDGLRQIKAFEVEVRLRSRDGFYRIFAVRAEPIFEAGQHVGWVGTNTDVQIHREGTERLRGALNAARLAGERSSLAESASGSFVYDWHPEADTVERSANFARVMGYAADELPGTAEAWRSLIHPEDWERLSSLGTNAEEKSQTEYRALHRDGSYRWLIDQARVVRGVEGQAQRVVGITTDITERKRLEAVLRENALQARLALEVASLGAWQWNPSSGEVEADARTREVCGLDPDATLSFEAIMERLHPEDHPRVGAALLAALEPDGSHAYAEEFRFVHADGTVRSVSSRGQTEFDPRTRRPISVFSTVQDITERLEVQRELVESEARFRNLADHAPVMIWVTEPDGSCSFLSRSWFEFTGQTEEEGLGFGWITATHPDDRERAEAAFLSANERGEAFQLEYRLRRADGVYRWAIDAATPRLSDDGQFLGYVGSVMDISERHTMEARLREINEAQRRFVGDAAHELRAPLTSIRGNLSLLARYPDMPLEDRLAAAQEAEHEAARLTRLISDLLTVARGEAQEQIVVEGVRLERVLEEAWRTARGLAERRRYDLKQLEPCRVSGDPDALKQLALILLENAVKYTPDDGLVCLELRVVDGWAEFRIGDSGPGIAAADLERVFERFYRTDRARSRTSGAGGTGLGLTIARSIATRHGGSVNLESALGSGTTAVVRLPLTSGESA